MGTGRHATLPTFLCEHINLNTHSHLSHFTHTFLEHSLSTHSYDIRPLATATHHHTPCLLPLDAGFLYYSALHFIFMRHASLCMHSSLSLSPWFHRLPCTTFTSLPGHCLTSLTCLSLSLFTTSLFWRTTHYTATHFAHIHARSPACISHTAHTAFSATYHDFTQVTTGLSGLTLLHCCSCIFTSTSLSHLPRCHSQVSLSRLLGPPLSSDFSRFSPHTHTRRLLLSPHTTLSLSAFSHNARLHMPWRGHTIWLHHTHCAHGSLFHHCSCTLPLPLLPTSLLPLSSTFVWNLSLLSPLSLMHILCTYLSTRHLCDICTHTPLHTSLCTLTHTLGVQVTTYATHFSLSGQIETSQYLTHTFTPVGGAIPHVSHDSLSPLPLIHAGHGATTTSVAWATHPPLPLPGGVPLEPHTFHLMAHWPHRLPAHTLTTRCLRCLHKGLLSLSCTHTHTGTSLWEGKTHTFYTHTPGTFLHFASLFSIDLHFLTSFASLYLITVWNWNNSTLPQDHACTSLTTPLVHNGTVSGPGWAAPFVFSA